MRGARGRLARWPYQVAIVVVVYEVYRYARIAVRGTPATAFRNARQLVRVERTLHIYLERRIQQWFLPHETLVRLFVAYYGVAHFIAVGFTLVLLWRRNRERYRFWRNVFGWVMLVGLAGFVLYPATPPRPAGRTASSTSPVTSVSGPLGAEHAPVGAAMSSRRASLHAAWSLWVLPLARRTALVDQGSPRRPLVIMDVTIIITKLVSRCRLIALGLAIRSRRRLHGFRFRRE